MQVTLVGRGRKGGPSRANIMTRFNRNPVIGDKFSSRHGQKVRARRRGALRRLAVRGAGGVLCGLPRRLGCWPTSTWAAGTPRHGLLAHLSTSTTLEEAPLAPAADRTTLGP